MFRDLHILADMIWDRWNRITTCGLRWRGFTQMHVLLDHSIFHLPMVSELGGLHYSSTLVEYCTATPAFSYMKSKNSHPTCHNLSAMTPCSAWLQTLPAEIL